MKEDRIYLLHIRDPLEHILSYTAPGKQAFFVDPRTQDAVIRTLEVVGEAVKPDAKHNRSSNTPVPMDGAES